MYFGLQVNPQRETYPPQIHNKSYPIRIVYCNIALFNAMGELHKFQLFVWVGKMLLQVLGHAEALLALLTEHRLHGLVRGEPLTILLVLRSL